MICLASLASDSNWQKKDVMIMGEVDNENGKCESVNYQARVSSEILSGKHTWAVVFPDLLISEKHVL